MDNDNTLVEIPSGNDFHPAVVALAFGVHRRTIFRWINYGHMNLVNSLVQREDVLKSLVDWRNTYSFKEARAALGVGNNATIHSWKKKGFLQVINVLGDDRVSQVSINALLARPGYKKKAKKHLLNSKFNGMLPKFAEPEHTLLSVAFEIDHIAEGFAKGPKSPPQKGSRKRLLFRESVRAYKRRHGSVEDRALKLYVPEKSSQRKALGARRLATFGDVAYFLGITLGETRTLLRKKSITALTFGETVFIDASSAEDHKKRLYSSKDSKGETVVSVKIPLSGSVERSSWEKVMTY